MVDTRRVGASAVEVADAHGRRAGHGRRRRRRAGNGRGEEGRAKHPPAARAMGEIKRRYTPEGAFDAAAYRWRPGSYRRR
jgi:hypothetical protein